MRFIFTASALCAVVSTFAAPSAADQITVYGSTRTYTIAQPAAKGPQPTIIMLHDAKGTGAAIAQSTKLDTLAPQQGFVAVFPDGLRQQWNFFLPGKELEFYVKASKASGGVPDDGAFIKSLIDDLVRRGIADPRRIFIAGESNGGSLALRMLCTDANLFAGAALLATAMPEKLGADCHPLRGLPILMIKGTKDDVLPYAGGLIEPEETFRVWPNDRLVKFLQVLNNQPGSPQSSSLPRRVPNPVKVEQWTACPGMPLAVYSVMDGPHIAPSDLNEGQVVLDFFASPSVVNSCVASLPPGASGITGPGGGSGAPGSNAATDPNAPQNNPPGTGANGPGTKPGAGNDPGQGTNTPSAANAPGTTDGPNATDPNAPNGSPNSASAPGGTDTAGLGPPDGGNSANPGGDTAGLGPPPDDSNPGNTAGLGPPPNDNPGNPTGGLGPPPNPPTTTAMGTPPMGSPPPYQPLPPIDVSMPIPNSPGNVCHPTPPMPPTAQPCHPAGGLQQGTTTIDRAKQPSAQGATINGGECHKSNGQTTCTDMAGNSCTTAGDFCNPAPQTTKANSGPLNLKPNTLLATPNPSPPPNSGGLRLQPATLPPPTLTPTGNVCNPKPATTSVATHDPSPKPKEVDKKPRPTNNNNAANAAANAAATAATATAIMGLVGALGHHGGGGGGGHFGGGHSGGGGGHSGGGGMGGNVCHHR